MACLFAESKNGLQPQLTTKVTEQHDIVTHDMNMNMSKRADRSTFYKRICSKRPTDWRARASRGPPASAARSR